MTATKTAAQLGRAFGQQEAKIETLLAELKAAFMACNADAEAERAFGKAWQASYMKARGANDTSARKAWSRYRGAALAGQTTVQTAADIKAKKAATAKGSKAKPAKGGALPAATAAANVGTRADGAKLGEASALELIIGAVGEMQGLRKAANGNELPTAKALAALCTSVIRKLEMATGRQLDI